MDSTDIKIARVKRRAKIGLLALIGVGLLLSICSLLLYRYTDWTLLLPEPREVNYTFRCDNRNIEYRNGGTWEDFIVKGVEISASSSDAKYEEYARWFVSISNMNANAVRVHTLMPPDFYRALYAHNEGGRSLWLIQGIELSDETFGEMTDLRSGNMVDLFYDEGRLVIDAVHGNKKTMGYELDVSDFTIAYIIGDHWDPDLVLYTDYVAKEIAGRYSGRYASVWSSADATATLLAEVFDDLFSYETKKYAQQHIMGLGNTQKTDLLFHDSSWATGLNENLAHVNTAHISKTDRVKTGVFAAYRIETGVMLNMSYDPAYTDYTDQNGRQSSLRYYLDALYNTYNQPLLISGTASAGRGVAGQDQIHGYDRGGIGESGQAEALCYLYEQALDAGFCGGTVGYYLDDPTRTAWNMEKVTRHNQRWLDVQDAEQCLGIVALEHAGTPVCTIDGDASEWRGKEVLVRSGGTLLQAAYDESYLYLHMKIPGYNPESDVVYVPLDITPLSGTSENPDQNLIFDRDMDFLLSINGKKRGKISVQEYYEPIEALYMQELEFAYWYVAPPERNSTKFLDVCQYVQPSLYPYAGDHVDAVMANAGLLHYGNGNPEAENYNSLADYCIAGQDIEVRIPWALLNFADPSRMQILGDFYTDGDAFLTIDAFYAGLNLFQDGSISSYPSAPLPLIGWEQVIWQERPRAAYSALQEMFRDIAS